jgi:hypothetical protein
MNKLMTITLSLVLLLLPTSRIALSQHHLGAPTQVAKIKADIVRRIQSQVTVRLANGSELRGRITATAENMFTIREDKARNPRHLSYSEVTRVNGRGLSRGAKFGILTAILTGTVLIGAFVSLKKTDRVETGVLR